MVLNYMALRAMCKYSTLLALEQCLDQRNLASTYVLCPSDLLVPNFVLERLEVLEYVRCQKGRFLMSWRCQKIRGVVEVELGSKLKLANVTEGCSYL